MLFCLAIALVNWKKQNFVRWTGRDIGIQIYIPVVNLVSPSGDRTAREKK
jgi:hypothetical protein